MLRSIVWACAALALVVAVPARAQDTPVVIKVASVAPEGTPWAKLVEGLKKRIEEKVPGKVKVKVFLNGVLGGEKESVEECKRGAVQMVGVSTGAIAGAVPELAVFELPFLFASDAEADYVLDKVFAETHKLMRDRGFELLQWSENGWHGWGVKKKFLKTPADVKGLKMRSQEGLVHLETFRSLGASPVEISVPEVLSSLQTGVVDGFSNTPLFSFATSWYQAIDHYTYSKHIYQPAVIAMNAKFFDSLAPDVQAALRSERELQQEAGRKGIRALTQPLLDNFKAAKIDVYVLSDAEREAFAKETKPVRKAYLKQTGEKGKKLLELVDKSIAEFRSKAK